ncbi:kap-1 [Pristionchus pacificus]|nr:kap-1 [Pristionchus pacificus]
MNRQGGVQNVVLDAHPHDLAVVVRYQLQDPKDHKIKSHQKIINLKELTEKVDIEWLASVVMEKCSLIPEGSRKDLEQILYYLQRTVNSRAHSASSMSERSTPNSASVNATMCEIELYIELLYEDITAKNRGSLCILELAKNPANLLVLSENETLVSALSRVLRDEWRKNLELAKTIISVFHLFSSFSQTQHIVIEQKMGAFCMNAIELELDRGRDWVNQMKTADEQTKKKCEIALRREHAMLGVSVSLLLNLAEDLSVETKMLRKGLLTLLSKCLFHATHPIHSHALLPPVLIFLIKLSVMVENHPLLEKEGIAQKVAGLFPMGESSTRRIALCLLFNLSFHPSIRSSLLSTGLIQHTAQLCKKDEKALNVLYQLTLSHDSRSLLPFTDAIEHLISDTLEGHASAVTKAILLNASLDKRSTQIMCGSKGTTIDSLMKLSVDHSDLLAAKIVRNMSSHDDTVDVFLLKWIGSLMSIVMEDGLSEEEAKEARATELLAISTQCRGVDWQKLNEEMRICEWLQSTLTSTKAPEHEPFQLQQVILASRLASTLEGAKSVVGLLDHFLSLLNSLQEDDELVVQLLFFFLCLLKHPQVGEMILEGEGSALPSYILDLMHDNNVRVMEQADEAARVIASLSPEWNKRFMTEKFRYYNAQWLEMVEKEGGEGEEEELTFDDRYVYYDDNYIDYDDESSSQLF